MIDQASQLDPEIDGVSGCAGFFRRNALMALSSIFPERFTAYFEDVDLCCRLRQVGHRFVFVPGSRVWHRGGSSHRRSAQLVKQQSCNEERVFCRNHHGSLREWRRHLAVLAGKAARRVSEGLVVPWLIGRLHAWTIEGSRGWTSSPVE
jgi:GT2 family glycosyltransferase